MRKENVLILASLLVSSFIMVSTPIRSLSAEPTTIYVDPSQIVDPSAYFNVSIKIDNVEGLAGVQWRLSWDPNLLYLVDLTEVMFHEIMPPTEWDNIWRVAYQIDNVGGQATCAFTFVSQSRARDGGYCPISGNHTMAFLTFQVKDIGNCTLDLYDSKLATEISELIPHDTIDGFFSNSIPPPPNPPSPSQNAEVLVYIDPKHVKNESLIMDSTFSVAIKLDALTNNSGFTLISYTLRWNQTLLECLSVEEIMFSQATPESEWGNLYAKIVINNTAGSLYCSYGFLNATLAEERGYGPIYGNQTLAFVTFRVIGIGKCLLHLPDCRIYQKSYGGLMLWASLSSVFANTLAGDINADDSVNLFDTILFANSFGTSSFSDDPRWNEDCDINCDEQIDIMDGIPLASRFGHSR